MTLHSATKSHICGMISMIRQACNLIEAELSLVSNEDYKRAPQESLDGSTQYLDAEHERELAKLMKLPTDEEGETSGF